MATPALQALRSHFDNAHLTGIMKPYVADVLNNTDLLDDQWFYDRNSSQPEQQAAQVIKRLKQGQFDCALLLTHSFRPAWMTWRAGIPKRVGYARYGRGPLLTHKLQPNKHPSSALDAYQELTKLIGCTSVSKQMTLATSAEDEQATDLVWNKLGLHDAKQVIAFNSSGAYGAAKLWPEDSFVELGRRLGRLEKTKILILCGPNETDLAKRMADKIGAHAVSLADQPLSIGLSKACVKRARLMVSTDSGPRHFAAAFGTPVVTLFGPTHIAWSETYFNHELQLQIPVDCGPCQKRVCPLKHHKCMTELSVDQVEQAVQLLLEESS